MANPPIRLQNVAIHSAAVAGAFLIDLIFSNPTTTLFWGGIIVLVTHIYLTYSEFCTAPIRITPLSFYFAWYTVGLGMSPIYYGLTLSENSCVLLSIAEVPVADVATGYLFFLVGSVALHAGVQLTRQSRRPGQSSGDVPFTLEWLIALWAVGIVLVATKYFNFLGGLTGIFKHGAMAAVCALALASPRLLKLRKEWFDILLYLGVASLFTINLSTGSKALLMFSFIPLGWRQLFFRSWGLRALVIGCALLTLYLAVIAPVVTAYRHIPDFGTKPIDEKIQIATNAFFQGEIRASNSELMHEQIEKFLERQFDPIVMGFFVGVVQSTGLQYGETMKYIAYAFIPRIIWPEKPNVTRGSWFTMYLGFSATEEDAKTSTGMTAAGELYWNYGIIGVLVGMFGIGCFVGGLWRMADADPRTKPLHMLLYVTLMFNMINMSEAVSVFVGNVVLFLFFKIAFVMLARPQIPRSHRAFQHSARTGTSY